MHVAILTFEGYNELDSLIALGVLNRVKGDGWRVTIATPTAKVTSMNGVVIEQMSTLGEACEADAVIVGSGVAVAMNPRRARTVTPGRFTFTLILWNLPSVFTADR